MSSQSAALGREGSADLGEAKAQACLVRGCQDDPTAAIPGAPPPTKGDRVPRGQDTEVCDKRIVG
jgi:hypothetical protein